MARQSVTMFDLRGGLNSESSPINMEPNELIDVSNIQINSDGSIEPRKAIDFLDTSYLNQFYSVNFGSLFGKEIAPCISALEVKLVDSTGTINPFIFVQVGKKVYIYDYSDIENLTTPATVHTEITLTGSDLAWQHKSILLVDRNRVLIINPYLQEGFISYDPFDALRFTAFTINYRNLADDSVIDSRVNYGGKSYLCIKSHNSSLASNLITGTATEDYWVPNGPEIAGDPAWSTVSTDGAGSWAPTKRYFYGDSIVENGYFWKISKVEIYDPELETWSEATWGDGYWFWSNREEPSWPATPVLNDTRFDYGRYTNYSFSGQRATWTAYATTSETANTVFNSSVREVSSSYSSNNEYGSSRFSAAEISQGRLWLSGFSRTPSSVYFSQTVDDEWRKYGRMYQFADPNSDTDTEKVDSDGGVLEIGAAENILALKNFGSGVLVFANNGVWYIYGQENFRPTNFSVEKVSDAGIISKSAITTYNNFVVYASIDGVYVIAPGDIETTKLKVQSITKKKINSFYNSIPLIEKKSSKLVVDSSKDTLYYYCNFETQDWSAARNVYNQPTDFRDVLTYSFPNDSWSKWSLSDSTDATDIAIAESFFVDGGQISLTNVVDNSGDNVVDESSVQVVAQDPAYTFNNLIQTFVSFQYDDTPGSEGVKLWFLQFRFDNIHTDFYNGTAGDYDKAYTWFATFAWNEFGDILHKKGIPYLKTVFERTESGTFVGGEDITAGGLYGRIDWNWSTTNKSPYYGTARQLYFPNRYTTSLYDGAVPGIQTVVTKHRVRGSGDVLRIHLSNDGSKPFRLYGYQMVVEGASNI